MKRDTTKVVAAQECAAGNDHAGQKWIETAVFSGDATASEILTWAARLPHSDGRLILTHPWSQEPESIQYMPEDV